ncbi:Endonuclease V family protein [Tritrichomonas foetus]|uniref:Endonuclease V family protein n=1 Tax=Tritrichomonas foetus TaxID=1144522 RepID=A0A1J4KPC1_9EUKA|nr:Endonuclease V family protein [Tritrichomonas foetus]|eukprot:OHT11644.1 Endonuclease V family protein [Tritrichomonas foetus]
MMSHSESLYSLKNINFFSEIHFSKMTADHLAAEKERLCALQLEMRDQINHSVSMDHPARYVGGADLTVEDDLYVGCFVVVDCENDLKPIYEKCTEMKVDIPYISGLLCFREGPVIFRLLEEFQKDLPDIKLDALLVDGSGEWHQRRFGLACYVGLKTGIPTIGVSKTFLYVGSEHSGKGVQNDAQSACPEVGDIMKISHTFDDGYEIACGVMRTTKSSPFKPIFVSTGHMIDFDSAVNIVRGLCHFREPEPLRLADRVSREYVRNKKNPPKKK